MYKSYTLTSTYAIHRVCVFSAEWVPKPKPSIFNSKPKPKPQTLHHITFFSSGFVRACVGRVGGVRG